MMGSGQQMLWQRSLDKGDFSEGYMGQHYSQLVEEKPLYARYETN